MCENHTTDERVEEFPLRMHCDRCASGLADSLDKVRGVRGVTVDAGAGTIRVRYDAAALDPDGLSARVRHLTGATAHPEVPDAPWWSDREALFTAIAGVWLGLGLVAAFLTPNPRLGGGGLWAVHLSDALYLLSVLFGGADAARAGWRAVLERRLGISALMTVAIAGAVAIGEFVEAASLAFLFAVAERLEGYAVDRTRHALRALLELAPTEAAVRRDGQERTVPAAEVAPGETALVRPGERVPLDGRVVKGSSSVNQAPITGESVPVDKAVGDAVYAGTLNEEGVLEIEVTKAAHDTTLARVIHLVERAEASKAPIERFVDRFGQAYTPAVVVLAALTALVPPLLWSAPFVDWFLRAITLLVIACPCAMVISTPVSVVSGITAAARNGVLIKGGAYLEAMAKVRAVALDKTGTLTTGELAVTDVVPLGEATRDEVLHLAASLSASSRHPISRAISSAAEGVDLSPAENFRSLTAQGVEGTVEGTRYKLGKLALFERAPTDDFERLEAEAKTVVAVGTETEVLGLVAVADAVRPEAKRAVAALKRAGLAVVLLTGDNAGTARAVAREVGIDQVHAGVLPDEKLAEIEKLRGEYGPVAMVGDGVNDAPALAAADVGVAMGAAGSDTALETADVALLGDDLSKLPYLVSLSRRARGVIAQNVFGSIALKLALGLSVFPGWVSLVAAVLVGDMGATLAVTGNALRLGRLRPKEDA